MKVFGYLISIVSVLLPGTSAWTGVARDSVLRLCLIAGMATPIAGTALRYYSCRRGEA